MSVLSALGKVLDRLDVQLTAAGTREGLCAFTVYPGDAAPADYGSEDCGGMGWARLVTAVPSVNFPASDLSVDNCAYRLAYSAEIGILRPGPIPAVFQQDMDLPDDAEHLAAAGLQYADMAAMHAALAGSRDDFDDMIIQSYVPLGPEGGVVGGSWQFVFALEQF